MKKSDAGVRTRNRNPNWNERSSCDERTANPHAPGIHSALAQVEAARQRHEELLARGQLPAVPLAAVQLPNGSLPGYTLLRELHRGGQGVVFLGVQASTDRNVAIKLLRLAPRALPTPAALARFEREIEILTRLKHRNVVTIHDCGRTDQFVYLVMDYVAGCPVDEYVRNSSSSLEHTLELFARICDGVNAAHLRGIIHRDLKPGNILVTEQGEPHVLDFGLAKLTDESSDALTQRDMTETGQFVGSLPWASPEQAEGRADGLDIRTDVYSLGVVLYQLLTGRFPYPVSGRLDDVVRHIVQTSPARPSTIDRAIDRELETILLKCLAKEPERRYQNAGELARDLRRYLAGEAIEARRDSLAYVMTKQLARYRVAALASGAVLVAVLAGLAISLAFWRQAEEQRVIALHNAAAAHAALARADDEADQSRAVIEFMREVLTSVEPEKQGADVRLSQVLANASIAAGQRFAAHPQREAQVRELLGKIYDSLSLWPESEREFRLALEIWKRSAGEDDPRTLRAESTWTGISLNLSRYREVENALSTLLPRLTGKFGPDHRTTLSARRTQAIAWLYQGRIDEAEPVLRELRAHPGLADDDDMQLRIALSLRDALHWRRAALPAGPQRTALLAEEQALAEEWLERSTRRNGPDAGVSLQARAILADIAFEQGRFQDSVDACRSLLSRIEGRLNPCHDTPAWAYAVLANALGRLGQNAEPVELYLRRIECLRPRGEPARLALLSSLTDSMGFFDRGARPVEGETLARELSAMVAKYGGAMAFSADLFVAGFVSMQGRLDQAEDLFRALLAREPQIDDRRTRARLHVLYGRHQVRRALFESAETQLNTAVELAGGVEEGTLSTHPDDLIVGFLELYDAWGKPDRAAEFRRLRANALAFPPVTE